MRSLYQPKTFFLQQVHPFTKIFSALLLVLWITIDKEKHLWIAPVLLFESVVMLVALGGFRWSQARSLLRFVAWMAVGYLILYTLVPMRPSVIRGATLWFKWGPITLSSATLWLGLITALRVLAYTAISLVFVATTSMERLLLACVQQARFPYRVGYAISAAFRSVPWVQSEWRQMRTAHRLRGFRPGGGLINRYRSVRRVAFPLLVRTIRRAQQVALAMESRAFGAFSQRTYLKKISFSWRDAVYLGVFFLFHGCLLIWGVVYSWRW